MTYALLIDDDTDIISSATHLVHSQGFTLETASTWEEGLDKFYALSPDLIISDFNLPGSEMGLSLLLRISLLRPSVRLVLISAYLNENDVDAILQFDLVHDVVRKIDSMNTARTILAEVRLACERASDPTDWPAFAAAFLRINQLDNDAFTILNQVLQNNRL